MNEGLRDDSMDRRIDGADARAFWDRERICWGFVYWRLEAGACRSGGVNSSIAIFAYLHQGRAFIISD